MGVTSVSAVFVDPGRGSCPLDKVVDSGACSIVDAVELNRETRSVVLAALDSDHVPPGLHGLRVIREVETQVYHGVVGNRSFRLYEAACRCEICSRSG